MNTLKNYIFISRFVVYNDLCFQYVVKLIDAIRIVSLPPLACFDEKLLIYFTTEDNFLNFSEFFFILAMNKSIALTYS